MSNHASEKFTVREWNGYVHEFDTREQRTAFVDATMRDGEWSYVEDKLRAAGVSEDKLAAAKVRYAERAR